MNLSDLLLHWRAALGADTTCQPLAERNFVYRVTAGDLVYILKEVGTVNPRGNVERKLAADFAVWRHVQAQGVPVALPVLTDEGQPYHLSDGRYFCLFPELPSQPDPSAALERVHANIGAAIARMHRALASYPGEIFSWTMDLPPRILDEAVPVIRRHLDTEGNTRLDAALAEISEPLRQALVGLPAQYLHGDCHGGNILLVGDQVSGFIDMDHMPYGPRIYEPCYNLCDTARKYFDQPESAELMFTTIIPSLFAGYEGVSPLTPAEKDAAPYMMMGIQLIIAGWLFEPANIPEWARGNVELFHWVNQNRARIQASI